MSTRDQLRHRQSFRILALACLSGVLLFPLLELWLDRQSAFTEGRIVALLDMRGKRDKGNPRVVVEFDAQDFSRLEADPEATQRIRFERSTSRPSPFSVGDEVRVRYRRNDPQRASIDDLRGRWGSTLWCLAGAGLFGWLGWRRGKAERP